MSDLSALRFRSLVTIYRVKYPEKTALLSSLRQDVLEAAESVLKNGGRTLVNTGADGVTAGWQSGMTEDERLNALTECLNYYEGRRITRGRIAV